MVDHQKAFEAFRKSRNYAEAQRAVGASYVTVCSWAEAGYVCKFGCPYHNWTGLLSAAERASSVKFKMMEQGQFDPLAHEVAMAVAVKEDVAVVPTVAKQDVVHRIIRGDLERIADWELVYRKLYFDLTGIALDVEALQFPTGVDRDAALREVFGRGLRTTNVDSAVRNLQIVQAEIEKLRTRITGDKPAPTQGADIASDTIDVTTLRALRDHISAQPTEAAEQHQ